MSTRKSHRQKNTRPTAIAGRVASDPSLAWSAFMITEDAEDVNSDMEYAKKGPSHCESGTGS